MKHGCARRGKATPEYRAWADMLARCRNPRHAAFSNYGGRGIEVCPAWSGFGSFLADLGPRPSSAYSIERIDNDGPYSPKNCHWALDSEQRRNHRRNRVLTVNGESLCVADWAARLGVTSKCLEHRLARGWDETRTVTVPSLGTRRVSLNGSPNPPAMRRAA